MRIKRGEINVYVTRYLDIVGSRLEPKSVGISGEFGSETAGTKATIREDDTIEKLILG